MSCTSNLFKSDNGYMVTYCPACGERIEVYEDDKYDTLPDGTDEYEIWCTNEDCQCHFYANVNYY